MSALYAFWSMRLVYLVKSYEPLLQPLFAIVHQAIARIRIGFRIVMKRQNLNFVHSLWGRAEAITLDHIHINCWFSLIINIEKAGNQQKY